MPHFMTNLEKYIAKIIKSIKKNKAADAEHHFTELVMVLEETLKYIPAGASISQDSGLFFVGYTNPHQLVYACDPSDDPSEQEGSFYSSTDGDTVIPLYMLRCHEDRLINLTGGNLNLSKLLNLQNGGTQ